MQLLDSANDRYKPRFSNGSRMCLIPPMAIRCVSSPRRRISYNRLQKPTLRLTILKLDGSSFGVELSNMGTVGELKQAVEAAFDHLPKEGPGRVSWEHVWGQFCLCHEGEMLLTDRYYISMIGIKDGDQLQFTRRDSSTNNFSRIESKEPDTGEDDEPHKDEHKNSEKDGSIPEEIVENKQDANWGLETGAVSQREHRLSLLLKGWFPYGKFNGSRLADRGCSSKSLCNMLGSLKNCLRISGNKYDSRRLTWKMK